MIRTISIGVCIVRKACIICDQHVELKSFQTFSVMTAQYSLEQCIHLVPSIALPIINVIFLIAYIADRPLKNAY